MKKHIETKDLIKAKSSEINHQEILPIAETQEDLNAKILKITMKIKNQFPELSKYLEEMSETIPDEKNPEISLKNLKTYYDSLETMLNKYILEHSLK